MKLLSVFIFVILWSLSHAQAPAKMVIGNTNLFAQGMFNIPGEEIEIAELALKDHPNVKIVRLDHYSNRFFILTKNIDSLTKEELRSWFGPNGAEITCIQIGVHGLDEVLPFPFTTCQD